TEAISAETSADPAIVPTPIAATALCGIRGPSSANKRAPAKGNAGTIQRSSSISSPHLAEGVRIQRLIHAVEFERQRQSHGYFRRRRRQNEQEHDLAVRLSPPLTCCNKGQTRGVQHHL